MCDKPAASSSGKEGNPKAKSHREVLEGAGPTADAAASAMTAPSRTAISLTVNGVSHRVEVEDRWTLVELLRDQLDLTGTKIGCDRSECGACTVLMNGQPVYACCQLAVWADGADVQTVEGLAHNGQSVARAASLHRSQCPTMRVLHARPTHDGHRTAQHGPQARRGAGATSPGRESLSLLEL